MQNSDGNLIFISLNNNYMTKIITMKNLSRS